MYKKVIVILLLLFLSFIESSCFAQTEDNDEFRFVVTSYERAGASDTQNKLAVEKISQYKPDFILSFGNMAEKKTSNCYSFEYKNNLFIYLDSASGLKKQSDFLKEALAKASQYTNIFITTNDSLWLKNDEWFKTIHPIIKNKVKYVFGTNNNFLSEKEIDDVIYITSGSPFYYSKENTENPSFPNFLIVAVNKRGAIAMVMPLKTMPEREFYRLIGSDPIYSRVLRTSEQRIYELTTNQGDLNTQSVTIIKTLNIKPNITILDIGAGAGFFTFLFADTLKGTGMVFATELTKSLITYIRKKTEENNYKNVAVVRVKKDGLDPFYKQHSFDIIFLCRAYSEILERLDYFRQLKPSLIKNSGRLYIIEKFRAIPDFNEKDFDDFRNIIKTLSLEGGNFPVFQRLHKEIQYFIRHWQGKDVPKTIQIKIIQDLNKILSDKFLLSDLSDYYNSNKKYSRKTISLYGFIYPNGLINKQDVQWVKWLIIQLYMQELFNKNKNFASIHNRSLVELNKRLLSVILNSNKLSSSEEGRNGIISTMESAGYQFVKSYDFIPGYHFLEFKRSF